MPPAFSLNLLRFTFGLMMGVMLSDILQQGLATSWFSALVLLLSMAAAGLHGWHSMRRQEADS